MTSVDTLEPGESPPPHRAHIQWGPAEIAALLAIVGSMLAGVGVAIKVAVAQDRTERSAMDAKTTAEKATTEVSSVKERLGGIEVQVRRIEGIDAKLDRLLERRNNQ